MKFSSAVASPRQSRFSRNPEMILNTPLIASDRVFATCPQSMVLNIPFRFLAKPAPRAAKSNVVRKVSSAPNMVFTPLPTICPAPSQSKPRIKPFKPLAIPLTAPLTLSCMPFQSRALILLIILLQEPAICSPIPSKLPLFHRFLILSRYWENLSEAAGVAAAVDPDEASLSC